MFAASFLRGFVITNLVGISTKLNKIDLEKFVLLNQSTIFAL